MNMIITAMFILIVGWGLGFLSFIELTNWAGGKVAYWKYFLDVCGDKCMMAMAIALDEHLKEKEFNSNELR